MPSRGTLLSYEELAREYYDPERHPTCRNLRDGSSYLLRKWLPGAIAKGSCAMCEVGAGRSLLAELLLDIGAGVDGLLITDASPSMLRHSQPLGAKGVRLVVARAEALPVAADSLDLLVASLGDPYNDAAFWQEVRRVLKPEGLCLYTTPSYEWARDYRLNRERSPIDGATFDMSNGRTIVVPSRVYDEREQARLVATHGLGILEAAQVRRSELPSEVLSPKLLPKLARDISVVTGYKIQRALS